MLNESYLFPSFLILFYIKLYIANFKLI